MNAPKDKRLLIAAAMLVGLALTASAAHRAVGTLGAPFPSFFFDPFGRFSIVFLPSWQTAALGIGHSDHVVAVAGRPIALHDRMVDPPAHEIAAVLRGRAEGGASHVSISFEREGRRFERACPVRRIDGRTVLLFFALYALVGWLVLWSGAAVLLLSRRPAGRAAYCFWAAAMFVFTVTFYDYHTTAVLVPLFSLASLAAPLGFFWLAYAFPEPPAPRRLPRRLLRGGLGAATIVAFGAWLLALCRGESAPVLREAVDLLAAPSIAALAVAVLLRLRWSEGRDRAELRCALGGLVVVPLALALSVGATLATGDDYMHLVLPFAVLAIPLSIAYALVRHNILRTEAVLTPAFFFVPIAVVTSIATLGTWLVLSSWPSIGRVPSLLSSAAAFFGVGFGLVRLTSCHLFAARQQFRPTIEMLSDELANLRDPEAVRGALEKVVLRWLPTSKVRVLHLAELRTGVPDLPPGWEAALASGERVWTTRDPWSRELLVPLRSLGKLRGALLVGPKRQGALYTDQDLALLDTIATLGAAAVHNAEVIRELEAFRRLEVEAARDEKRHALGLLGAEISHEISYSLNFFRYLMEQSGQGTALSQQDVEIGQEEVERLQRMLVTLRRLKAPAAANEPVQIARPLNRALRLIHDLLESGGIRVVNEVPEDARVVASSDSLVQVFANLLRNAAQAAGPGGEIGVRLIETPESSFIEIWDSGAGLSPDLASVAFNPWVTTKADGSGLGLAVTQRIVRSYGWTISFCRHQERTIFRLELPAHPGAERTPTPEPTP